MPDDIITTERQRINWENPIAQELLEWGQARIKQLLLIWKERRGEEKRRQLDQKLRPFASRLERLQSSERKTVSTAIRKLASVPTLTDVEFDELASAILTAWEQGRLRNLIERLASLSDEDAGVVVSIMGETEVLTVLQLAEVLKTKLDLVRELRKRIDARQLENVVRDYIAKHPWLVRPDLELYKSEVSLGKLLKEIADDINLEENPDFAKRVDLLLANGEHLVLLEFMRPGVTLDRDHIDRFTRYCDEIKARIGANTAGPFRRLTGIIVADRLEKSKAGNRIALERLADADLYAFDWDTLLAGAERQFRDYFEVMVERTPDDPRVRQLETRNPDAIPLVESRRETKSGRDEALVSAESRPQTPSRRKRRKSARRN